MTIPNDKYIFDRIRAHFVFLCLTEFLKTQMFYLINVYFTVHLLGTRIWKTGGFKKEFFRELI